MQMQWTAEAIADLKRLALEGKSASAIAAALGGASRNAVIGKANRIGIKLSGGGRTGALSTTPARAGRAQWATARYPRPSAGTHGSDVALAREPERAAWIFGEAEVGEMRLVRFEDIREFACRWPLGDPRSREFAYCGLTPAGGQSYCAGHCRMAYRPPQARQRARDRQGLGTIPSSWRLS
jgi:GcrA cell cycle regulator